MIREFKKRIFCREAGYSLQEVDSGDQLWIERIDDFFRRNSLLPPDGDPNEYSAAFEAIYPNEKQRRQYIDDAISKGTPCFGHRVLAALMSSKQVSCVFTTNFSTRYLSAAGAITFPRDLGRKCEFGFWENGRQRSVLSRPFP